MHLRFSTTLQLDLTHNYLKILHSCKFTASRGGTYKIQGSWSTSFSTSYFRPTPRPSIEYDSSPLLFSIYHIHSKVCDGEVEPSLSHDFAIWIVHRSPTCCVKLLRAIFGLNGATKNHNFHAQGPDVILQYHHNHQMFFSKVQSYNECFFWQKPG